MDLEGRAGESPQRRDIDWLGDDPFEAQSTSAAGDRDEPAHRYAIVLIKPNLGRFGADPVIHRMVSVSHCTVLVHPTFSTQQGPVSFMWFPCLQLTMLFQAINGDDSWQTPSSHCSMAN